MLQSEFYLIIITLIIISVLVFYLFLKKKTNIFFRFAEFIHGYKVLVFKNFLESKMFLDFKEFMNICVGLRFKKFVSSYFIRDFLNPVLWIFFFNIMFLFVFLFFATYWDFFIKFFLNALLFEFFIFFLTLIIFLYFVYSFFESPQKGFLSKELFFLVISFIFIFFFLFICFFIFKDFTMPNLFASEIFYKKYSKVDLTQVKISLESIIELQNFLELINLQNDLFQRDRIFEDLILEDKISAFEFFVLLEKLQHFHFQNVRLFLIFLFGLWIIITFFLFFLKKSTLKSFFVWGFVSLFFIIFFFMFFKEVPNFLFSEIDGASFVTINENILKSVYVHKMNIDLFNENLKIFSLHSRFPFFERDDKVSLYHFLDQWIAVQKEVDKALAKATFFDKLIVQILVRISNHARIRFFT